MEKYHLQFNKEPKKNVKNPGKNTRMEMARDLEAHFTYIDPNLKDQLLQGDEVTTVYDPKDPFVPDYENVIYSEESKLLPQKEQIDPKNILSTSLGDIAEGRRINMSEAKKAIRKMNEHANEVERKRIRRREIEIQEMKAEKERARQEEIELELEKKTRRY